MEADNNKTDKTATERQQRRRDKLKLAGGRKAEAILSKEQGKKLDALIKVGFAENKSAVLVKSMEEAYDRTIKQKRRTQKGRE